MPTLVISMDDVVIKHVSLTKDMTAIGRRPYNDLVIDNLAVSGEHAAILLKDGKAQLQDRNSTNGTYLNGKPIKKEVLEDGDVIDIGRYKLQYFDGESEQQLSQHSISINSKTMIQSEADRKAAQTLQSGFSTMFHDNGIQLSEISAVIRILNGAAAGREIPLNKIVITIGKPGLAVAAISKRIEGFFFQQVNGEKSAQINGQETGNKPFLLKDGNIIDLADVQMEFHLK